MAKDNRWFKWQNYFLLLFQAGFLALWNWVVPFTNFIVFFFALLISNLGFYLLFKLSKWRWMEAEV